MQDFKNKRILLCICGGIAAYKIPFLIRSLTELGAQIKVVMTHSAESFITPMTLTALVGEPPRRDLFDVGAESGMGHIELAKWADYCLIAPATANIISKLAHGQADDLVSTLALVLDVPLLICPSMNQAMWHHDATQANLNILKSRGVMILGPAEGTQACGDYGLGRMVEPEEMIQSLRVTNVNQLLKGQDVIITAGPTREWVDPVRYLSNRSSGKMGYALAYAAQFSGANVTLVSGPSDQRPPTGIKYQSVHTAQEMYDVVMQILTPGCIFIGAAAVSDFTPSEYATNKIKKSQILEQSEGYPLSLRKTLDILAAVSNSAKARYVLGFAAETTNVLAHAKQKLISKKLNGMIANHVGRDLGFDQDEHELVVLTPCQEMPLARDHKTRLASQIIRFIADEINPLKQTQDTKEYDETFHTT